MHEVELDRTTIAGPVGPRDSPCREVNGYQEMLFPNGKHTWIATKDIVPWSSLSDPTARCVPSMMSNGKPGFAYPH
jgi:hypothetical protein